MRSHRRRAPLRLVSAAVLVLVVCTAVGFWMLTRSVITDEQKRLLHSRAEEVGALVATIYSSMGSDLPSLAAAAQSAPGPSAAFTAIAEPDVAAASTIGVLEQQGGVIHSVFTIGKGPAVGADGTAGLSALATRALSTKGMVSSMVATVNGPRLTFALAASPTVVIYKSLSYDPTKPTVNTTGPFSELDGVVYAAPRADPTSVVITTTSKLRLTGQTTTLLINVGADKWLLIVKSRGTLVGSIALDASWALLGAGLLAAVLATVLVETLARRRAYALSLVEARTVDLQDARSAAEAANHAKSDFLSRMSHELRTPLNAILGFGQLLEIDDTDPDHQEAIGQILKGGRHLLDLINEVLDISRIESGTLSLSPEPVSVADSVADVVVLMRPLADERHIRLQTDGLDGSDFDHRLYVTADRQRLKQVLLNLVANAVKYNREGGEVAVSIDDTVTGRLRIIVSDTGPGIKKEDVPKLFVPFERLGAEATGVEGTGVGLALSARLAEIMGGTVGVESEYGHGSRFFVELPVAENPLQQYQGDHGDTGGSDSQDVQPVVAHKILYVEDNLSNLALVERILANRKDLQLVPAMQGRLGLTLAKERPAIILLDLHLPDIGGDEVLRQLRADPLTADIPVVILSADATPGRATRLLAAGATAYLTKPFDVRQLLTVLDEQLASMSPAP